MIEDREGFSFQPLTADRWSDLERLFGERGAYGGCWCMYWRTTRREFERDQGEGNRQSLRSQVESGLVPGILAYRQGQPVGWCSVAPREQYPSLNRSPVLKPLDDHPVWSIVCFFIDKDHRGRGLAGLLIEAAVEYAGTKGATIVEAYPTKPRGRQLAPVSVYMGLPALFEQAGFQRVAEPSESKAVMRYFLGPPSG